MYHLKPDLGPPDDRYARILPSFLGIVVFTGKVRAFLD
jgi:hypothetical protein